MRLIYVHKSLHARPAWNAELPTQQTSNGLLVKDFATDGHPAFLEALISSGMVDEVLVIVESGISPGVCKIGNLNGLVLPNLDGLWPEIRHDDVFFMRGGYRWWIPFVEKLKKRGHWIIFYSAGTNRNTWPFWDVIMWDFIDEPLTKRGKLYLPYKKPISDVFRYKQMPMEYDLCIGASNIYDSKQQWRFVEAVQAYEKMYNEKLKVIMPGGYRKSAISLKMMNKIHSGEYDIEVGTFSRDRLAEIFNQTRLFCHHDNGQTSRGALEALACGVPMLSLYPGRHRYATWVHAVHLVAESPDNPEGLAQDIRAALYEFKDIDKEEHGDVHAEYREHVAETFQKHNNVGDMIGYLAPFFKLVDTKIDRATLVKEYLWQKP